jgi:hypothetical protein
LDYDDFQVASSPSWLSGDNGTMWNRVLGIVKDSFAAAARSAVKARFAATAAVDGLVYLLDESNLDPAWRENETSVRARIRARWQTWGTVGTIEGVAAALTLAGYTNFQVNDQKLDGTLKWWEFEIILFPPFPWLDTSKSDGAWDDAGVWDDGGSVDDR